MHRTSANVEGSKARQIFLLRKLIIKYVGKKISCQILSCLFPAGSLRFPGCISVLSAGEKATSKY